MRTAEEYGAEFNWLTPREFARRAGLLKPSGKPSPEMVRQIIHDGTSEALRPPHVMDISRSSVPRYRIDPEAVELYHEESVRRLEERLAS